MKFFKNLLNKRQSTDLNTDDSEAIFSMASASLLLKEKLDLKFEDVGSLCIKIIHGTYFQKAIEDCENFLNVSKKEFLFEYKIITDRFDHIWFIIEGHDKGGSHYDNITNIAAALSSLGDIIEERGFSSEVLAVIFKFKFLTDMIGINKRKPLSIRDSDSRLKGGVYSQMNNEMVVVYILYNYKTNKFYPIVLNSEERSMTMQMKIISIIGNSVPIENDFSKWYPIRDIPF